MSSLDFLGELPKPLPKEELDNLFHQMKSGDKKAREKIILHNLKLVLYEVNHKFCYSFCEKDELIDIGIIALIKSVDAFDFSYNRAFSTFAISCIDHEIFKYIKKVRKYIDDISLETPTTINSGKRESIVGVGNKLRDILLDPTADSFIDEYEDLELVSTILDNLDEKEKYIVTKYYGFNSNKTMTQKEIGNELGVYQSTIQQHLKAFLRKTRKNLNLNEELVKKRTK